MVDEVNDSSGTYQALQRNLVNGVAALNEVVGRVDMCAMVAE
jgi:hypothetical protein